MQRISFSSLLSSAPTCGWGFGRMTYPHQLMRVLLLMERISGD
ncbi:23S rRNA (pseudouridine(1915)-N(3))-methyltransferase RlmH [Paenibacillus elgii]|nr:23S rRNA (pseudouridine(1915)-N(3))-methyltransferase RlmH [Paenibacillus elgii]